jgi:hypothetical protein
VTHYQLLGVHQDASSHAIKLAYRRLVKIYHPDRASDAPFNAEEKMRKLNEAYAILSKSDKRRQYDQSLAVPQSRYSHPTAQARWRSQNPASGMEANENSGADVSAGAPGATSPQRPPKTPPKSRAEELHEEIHSEGFLKRFSTEYGNRFESKDAFITLTIAFFLMMSPPPGYLNIGNVILGWPFFGAAIVAALGARFGAAVYFSHRFKGGADGFSVLALSNLTAAVTFGFMARFIEAFLHQSLFAFPIMPALIAAFIPGAVGAGMGRALNRSVGAVYGVAGGALAGGIISIFFGLWCVMFQLAAMGAKASEANSDILEKPLKAVIIAAILGGALGSFRVNRLFIFSALDWVEGWFERFRPAAERGSKALTRVR